MIGQIFSDEELRKRGIVTDQSVGLLASTAAMRWPDRTFLHFDDKQFTFSELANRIDLVASDYLARGLKSGNRMFIQADNCVGALVTIMACWRVGIIPVPAISAYRRHELLQILDDTKPDAVATTAELRGRYHLKEMEDLLSELGHSPAVRYIVEGPADEPDWIQIPRQDQVNGPIESLPLPPDPDRTALILFTSGTTSRPKGVNISGTAIITNTLHWVRTLGLSEAHTWFAAWPLAHIAALSTAVFTPLMVGAKTVMASTWKPEEAIHMIAQHRVYILAGSTVFLHDLVKAYRSNPDISYRIPVVGVGGSMTSPELVEEADGMGIKAFRSFGMTELTGVAALTQPDAPLKRRANYDGFVHLGTEIDVVDDSRTSVGFGELGEIRVRGPHRMISYTDPDANASTTDGDGWVYTGDIGLVEEPGWVKIAGRKKDIINRGGEKFSSSDIEQAILSHESVDEVAALGVPDERFGEKVAAFIVLKHGIKWIGPENILEHLEGLQLAKIKRPVEWHVLDQLPRTSTGKVQKNVLLDDRNRKEGRGTEEN